MSLKRKTQEYVLTEVKIDAVKANISKTTSGIYTGNDSANRAIPHGLSSVPTAVFIQRDDGYCFMILGSGEVLMLGTTSGGFIYNVTLPDITNFYVGNSGNYANSANGSTLIMKWVVIK